MSKTTIVLSPYDAALILSPTEGIQVAFADNVLNMLPVVNGDIFAIDGDQLMAPSHLATMLAILIGDDPEFPRYVYERVLEVQGKGEGGEEEE